MLLNIGKLPVGEYPRGHVLILDALIGQKGGGQSRAQTWRAFQLPGVPGGEGIAALPEGLQLLTGHALQFTVKCFCLLKKAGQVFPGKRVRVRLHLFCR